VVGGTPSETPISDLAATATSSSEITLTWSDLQDTETGFEIERSTDGVSFSPLITTLANIVAYGDSGLAASTTYYYRVRATGITVAWSNTANATTMAATVTAPISDLAATVASDTQINLTWSDLYDWETGFEIERGTDGVTFAALTTTLAGVTVYGDSGLTASTLYYYRIRPTGEHSVDWSNVASATTYMQAGAGVIQDDIFSVAADTPLADHISRIGRGYADADVTSYIVGTTGVRTTSASSSNHAIVALPLPDENHLSRITGSLNSTSAGRTLTAVCRHDGDPHLGDGTEADRIAYSFEVRLDYCRLRVAIPGSSADLYTWTGWAAANGLTDTSIVDSELRAITIDDARVRLYPRIRIDGGMWIDLDTYDDTTFVLRGGRPGLCTRYVEPRITAFYAEEVGEPGATLTQHSFRFYDDDGSESASTALAAENTALNLSPGATARLRFLIDADGDPDGKQFQVEYRKKPSGGTFGNWTKVQ
jgi:hypothetical protein